MKPNPFESLNHFTVPSDICATPLLLGFVRKPLLKKTGFPNVVKSGGMPVARHAVLHGMPIWLDGHNIGRCRPFGAVNDIEADPLAFLQAFEALGLDG
jgi:hypothetical protein